MYILWPTVISFGFQVLILNANTSLKPIEQSTQTLGGTFLHIVEALTFHVSGMWIKMGYHRKNHAQSENDNRKVHEELQLTKTAKKDEKLILKDACEVY